MTAPDFDRFKSLWAEHGRRIDDSLVLDIDAVRASLDRRTSAAFARHRRWRSVGLLAAGTLLAALGAFIARHWGQWEWVAVAALLLPLLVTECVVDLREWWSLRRLDLDAPIVRVRGLLHKLRWRRLRLAKAYMLLSILLWWPFVLVVFKGLLGADLLHSLAPSVTLVNLAVGLAFIPAAQLVAWLLARKYGHRPGWQRFLDDSAGRAWRMTSDEVATREAFEAAVANGRLAQAPAMLPGEISDALVLLRRRLLGGIIGCAGLIALLGLFMANEGWRSAQLIVPGVLLLWTVLSHMIVQIMNREALTRLTDLSAVRDRLMSAIALRLRVGRWTLVSAPALALLLAAVVLRLAGVSWWLQVPTAAAVIAGILALAASALLAWRLHASVGAFPSRLVDWICLGFPGRAQRLVNRLPD